VIKIAHRGNINGPNPDQENKPDYIDEAIIKGYSVEVDVWLIEGNFFLGHDMPSHSTTIHFLNNDKLWCHCKNIDALRKLLEENIRCFFHNNDEATLTSDGYIWTYPGKHLTEKSICVMPEKDNWNIPKGVAGVCSDFLENIGEYIK
tara:strand:- start:919 stop:1359 length:441 start_codon:yes stop_codon:yes gene_type:complete